VVVASTAGSQAPAVAHVPVPVDAGAHVAPAVHAPDADSYKQVGSILLNMKPAEAARIMSYLNDDQVEGLLRSMSPRQAAGVLGQLAPERGAVLSRRLLVPAKETRP
jgi:Mg/Co/Ni transporter MgtE